MVRSLAIALVLIACGLGNMVFGAVAETKGPIGATSSKCVAPPCCGECYAKKTPPCVACPNVSGTCAAYCKKPIPCVFVARPCGCPDNYCKKPLPNSCVTRPWEFYRCAPLACKCPGEVEPRATAASPVRPDAAQ